MFLNCIIWVSPLLCIGLVTGANQNSSEACYNNDDDGVNGCPKGTLYNDLYMTTSK